MREFSQIAQQTLEAANSELRTLLRSERDALRSADNARLDAIRLTEEVRWQLSVAVQERDSSQQAAREASAAHDAQVKQYEELEQEKNMLQSELGRSEETSRKLSAELNDVKAAKMGSDQELEMARKSLDESSVEVARLLTQRDSAQDELANLYGVAQEVIGKVFGTSQGSSDINNRFSATPAEVDELVYHGVLFGANTVLTSVRSHYPELDLETACTQYAPGFDEAALSDLSAGPCERNCKPGDSGVGEDCSSLLAGS